MTTASPQLLRVLIRQNEESLRGMRANPPADVDSPTGRAFRMTVDQLREQTITLNERLADALAFPVPKPRGRTWRDIPPAGSWK